MPKGWAGSVMCGGMHAGCLAGQAGFVWGLRLLGGSKLVGVGAAGLPARTMAMAARLCTAAGAAFVSGPDWRDVQQYLQDAWGAQQSGERFICAWVVKESRAFRGNLWLVARG